MYQEKLQKAYNYNIINLFLFFSIFNQVSLEFLILSSYLICLSDVIKIFYTSSVKLHISLTRLHLILHKKPDKYSKEMSNNQMHQRIHENMDEQTIVDKQFKTEVFQQISQNDTSPCNQAQDSSKGLWSLQQEKRLFQLHDQLGNKWAIIAQQIGNRNDNSVKNHFYSKLRKALRKLNKIVNLTFKKETKQIKVIVIYKIIQATEQKHKQNPFCNPEVSELCTELKNRLLEYSYDEKQINDYEKNPVFAHDIIRDLVNFSKQYKRKTKKVRKNSVQDNQLLSPTRVNKSKKLNSQCQQSDGSSLIPSDCSLFSGQISETNSDKKLKDLQNVVTRRRAKSKQEIFIKKSHSAQQVKFSPMDQQQEVEDVLKYTGILQQEFLPPLPSMMKKQTQNDPNQIQTHEMKQDFQYFQESSMQMRIFSAKRQDHFRDPMLNEKNFNMFE